MFGWLYVSMSLFFIFLLFTILVSFSFRLPVCLTFCSSVWLDVWLVIRQHVSFLHFPSFYHISFIFFPSASLSYFLLVCLAGCLAGYTSACLFSSFSFFLPY